MAVYVSNLVIDCEADFQQTFTLEDQTTNAAKNLSGHTFSAHLRKHAASSTYTSFSSSVSNAAGGEFKLVLTDSQTGNLTPGRYVYDVLMSAPDGTKTRVVEGMAIVREGVTR